MSLVFLAALLYFLLSSSIFDRHNTEPYQRLEPKRNTSNKCFTYHSRYERCMRLRQKPSYEVSLELKRAFSSRLANEVALIRPGTEEWSEDHWFNMCSFILEAAEDPNRHSFILVMSEHLDKVPREFMPVVQLIDQGMLRDKFGEEHYESGHHHGDLSVAWWLQQHPQYDFIWAIEGDVRFIGHYGDYFTLSRQKAMQQNGSYISHLPVDDPTGHADLIFAHKGPGFLGSDYKGDWYWAGNKHMRGEWSKHLPNVSTAAYLMTMGMSRRLTEAIMKTALSGNSNEIQEMFTPTVGALNRYKLSHVQWDGPFDCCRPELSRMFYSKWMRNTSLCFTNHLIHPIKSDYKL